jgi:uncharacterized protein DUF5343
VAPLRENFLPYASTGSVLAVIDHHRDRGGLPERVTVQWLEKIGITDATAERVHQALRFLGLVDDEGRRTTAAMRLKTASSEEYPKVLADLVRQAYQGIFETTGPDVRGLDTTRLKDYFRGYEPYTQVDRMVGLFQGLLQEAELLEGGPVPRQPRTRRATEKRREAPTNEHTPQVKGHVGANASQPETDTSAHQPATLPPSSGGDGAVDAHYELLKAALRQLPADFKWTKAKRDRWVALITAGVDLLVEVVEPEASAPGEQA